MRCRKGPVGAYQITAAEIAAVTGGRYIFGFEASGVSIDTRSLQPGDLFIAIEAERDGHDFVEEAFEKGAVGAVVQRTPKGALGPMVWVENTLSALNDIARYARDRSGARVIAVTGSVGKTSTKEMLRCALSEQASVNAAQASYNNHIGVPLTLARTPKGADLIIVEIGMNHPGEIRPLSKLARPDVAIVTNVAAAHLAAFRSVDFIALEKAQIFAGMKPGGVAIYNADTVRSDILARAATESAATLVSFGVSENAAMKSLLVEPCETGSTAFLYISGCVHTCRLQVSGSHAALNALAALSAIDCIGLDVAKASRALSRWSPPAGRGTREVIEIHPGQTIELIDDAFNANPASVASGLDTLRLVEPRNGGRRIAVLGDMLELGDQAHRMHAEIAQVSSLNQIDRIDCIGPLMASLWEVLPESKRGICLPGPDNFPLAGRFQDGDVVLVKGSKGSKTSAVAERLRGLRTDAAA